MALINGFLLGLSTGIFCLAYCAPVYIPQLLSESDKRQGWMVFIKFNSGRLIAYIIFGALFSWLGLQAHADFLQRFSAWIMILLSILLLLYGLGMSLPKLKFCALIKKAKVPFISGFLLGINICPPFLVALIYNFQSANVISGIMFFVAFFVGTTLYLIPITFLGLLNRLTGIKQAARLAAIIVALILLYQNFSLI